MSRFKYQERSAETVQARAKQTGGDYDSYLDPKVPTVKIKEGQNDLRILPPTWGKKEWGDNWGIEVWAHGNVGPDNQSYLCPKKMKGEDCVLCDAVRDMDPEDAKQIKAKKRILAYVINRDEEKVGPQVWNLSWSLEKDIQTRSIDKKTGAVIALDHPDHGYDISFVREGAKLNTRYVGVEISRDESPLSERESRQDAWLEFIEDTPLPSLLVFHDQEHIENVFAGKSSKEDKDEEEDKPSRSRKRARSEDGDEEDEKPKRRSRASDDDDEEEEEKPKRQSSRSRDEDDDEDDRLPSDEEMKHNAKRARRQSEDEDEADDKPKRRSSRASEDDEEAEKPKRRRIVEDDEEEEEKPKRRRIIEDEDEADDKPKRRSRASEDEDDEEEEKPRKRATKPKEEDEDEDEADTSTNRAKRSLERLKPGKRR